MEGFIVEQNRAGLQSPIIGFKGFSISYDSGVPVKVTDQRNTNQQGVIITALNPLTGIPTTAVTDNQGNAIINLDDSNPNTITYTKNKDSKVFSYTGGGQISLVLEEFYYPIN